MARTRKCAISLIYLLLGLLVRLRAASSRPFATRFFRSIMSATMSGTTSSGASTAGAPALLRLLRSDVSCDARVKIAADVTHDVGGLG